MKLGDDNNTKEFDQTVGEMEGFIYLISALDIAGVKRLTDSVLHLEYFPKDSQ